MSNPTFYNLDKPTGAYFTLWTTAVNPWTLTLPWQYEETATGNIFTNLSK